jgi:hypothetical protein
MKRRDLIRILGATMLLPSAVRASDLSAVGNGHVIVDPRIELMSVVHLLAGYFLTTRSSIAYKAEALRFLHLIAVIPLLRWRRILPRQHYP